MKSTSLKGFSENREGLDKLANSLLDKEVIFSDDLKAVFGTRPWGDTSTMMGDMIPSEEDLEETKNDGLPVEEESEETDNKSESETDVDATTPNTEEEDPKKKDATPVE